MDGATPQFPVATFQPEPVTCDCPNGTYTSAAAFARLLDTAIEYYAPPRWVRYLIGTIFLAWYVATTAQRWLDAMVTFAKMRRDRENARELSGFEKDMPEGVKEGLL